MASISKQSSSEFDIFNRTIDISEFIAAEPEINEEEEAEDPEWSEDFKYTYDGERIMPKRKVTLEPEPELKEEEEEPAKKPIAKSSKPTEEKIPEYVTRWKAEALSINPFWPAQNITKYCTWISSDEQARRDADKAWCLSIPQEDLLAHMNHPDFCHIVNVRMAAQFEKVRKLVAAKTKAEVLKECRKGWLPAF